MAIKHIKRVVEFCQNLLQSAKQPRDDYKECLELTLFVLGSPPENFNFKACGAFHKARWMASLIYALKMFLFRALLPETIADSKAYLSQLVHFVVFAVLFYVEHWFSAPLASEAPFTEYRKHTKIVADAVLDKFYRHTWYLNPILFIFKEIIK